MRMATLPNSLSRPLFLCAALWSLRAVGRPAILGGLFLQLGSELLLQVRAIGSSPDELPLASISPNSRGPHFTAQRLPLERLSKTIGSNPLLASTLHVAPDIAGTASNEDFHICKTDFVRAFEQT